MKKILMLAMLFAVSGCYVPADYYYDDTYVVSDGYAAPAYATSSVQTTYVSAAPSVVYVEQPEVVYYDSPFIYSRPYYSPRPHHYNPPHHAPHKPQPHHGGHHAQPQPHHGGHHAQPQPHGGSHGGGHSGSHGGHHK